MKVQNFNKKISKENLKNPKDDFNKPRIFKIPSEEAIQHVRRMQPDSNDDDMLLRRIVEVGNVDMLQNRLQTHRDIARHWDPQNPIISLRRAINTGDQAILVDLLTVYNQKLSLWTLNTGLVVLPELRYLLQSKKLFFIQTAASTLKLILKNFGPVIAINVNQPPPSGGGVDISREERYEKCHDSYAHLNSIRECISTTKFDRNTPEISRIIEEVKRAFSALD